MKAIIFAGPSLPPAHRPMLPGIDWRPPARQGDVYRAALERPAIIGVVDGVFELVPTVWHKEILWAMTEGIHVYGAASIGALRAAELDVFGMVGIGRVYEAFRDGTLQDDDEVALLHGPEEVGYAPLTEAMVNVRATLECAVLTGVIAAATAIRLTEVAKAIFYKERTWAAIFRSAGRAAISDLYQPAERMTRGWLRPLPSWPGLIRPSAPDGPRADGRLKPGHDVVRGAGATDSESSYLRQLALDVSAVCGWLTDVRIDQKQQDARAMTEAIGASLTSVVQPFAASFQFASTAAWKALR